MSKMWKGIVVKKKTITGWWPKDWPEYLKNRWLVKLSSSKSLFGEKAVKVKITIEEVGE